MCFAAGELKPAFLSRDPHSGDPLVACYRAEDLGAVGRDIYYALKILKTALPPP